MSIEGRIAIDVSFADSATSTGVQSLKKISLVDTTAYTTGKVAIVTGTAGTASVNVFTDPSSYKNASGDSVSFSSVSRVVLHSDDSCVLTDDASSMRLAVNGGAAISDTESGGIGFFVVQTTAGTASYTLVLYGT